MKSMNIKDAAMATVVMSLWGLNFVLIHLGLHDLSPYWLCCLRFFFASVPLVFFIKRPAAPFKWVIAYGLINYAVQYFLLFCGMQLGMPAGLAALLYQTQVFFSILIAALLFKEKIQFWQIIGILTAFCGVGIIFAHLDGSTTLIGFILTIMAAFCWALGNIITKRVGNVNMLALVVWGNFVSWPPMLLFTLILEGPSSIHTLANISSLGIISVVYIAFISTVFCFSMWNRLLKRYPVSTVAPFTLSVPVFAMLSSYLIVNEPITSWKIWAGVFIMSGLVINLFGAQLKKIIKNIKSKRDLVLN